MKQKKEIIKEYFETGDRPTQEQYAHLIDSYIDAKQPEGESNRRFIISDTGEVNVAPELKVPEYTFSEVTGNKLALLKDGLTVKEIDLTPYIDDTNLARLVSGVVDTNGIATFTRDDNSIFTVDLSNLRGEKKGFIPYTGATKDVDLGQNKLIAKDITLTADGTSSIQSTTLTTANKNVLQVFPKNVRLGNQTANLVLQGLNGIHLYVGGDNSKKTVWHSGNLQPKTYQAGANISIDATNPQSPIINAMGGSSTTTDLSYNATTRTIESSSGNNIVLPLADATNTGLMKANFYEEGNWNIEINVGATSITPGSIKSKYIRNGNKVTFNFEISNFSTVGLTGLIQLNLPFPVYHISQSGVISGTVAYFDAGSSSNSIQYTETVLNLEMTSKLNFLKNFRLSRVTGSDVVFDGVNAKINVSGSYITNVYKP